MPEKWTGEFIGRCHNAGIANTDIAKRLGFTKSYVSMILHGARNPPGAQERFNAALDELIREKEKSPPKETG